MLSTLSDSLLYPSSLLLPCLSSWGLVLCCLALSGAWILVSRCFGGGAPGPTQTPSSSSLPCLPWVPVLGSLPWLGGSLAPHLRFTQLANRYGPLYGLYLGPHYTVVINSHQHAREVLQQRGKEYAGRPQMVTTDLLTRGGKDIAFADYSPLWRNHRRLVHNSFTLFGEGTSKLQDMVLEAVDSLCVDLQTTRGQPTDPGPALTRAVTNIVCRLVFSSTYRHDDPELKEVMDYNDGIVATIAKGGLVDIYPWLQVFPSKTLRRLKECVTIRDQLLHRKLQEHKTSLSDGQPRDLLEALLQGQTRVNPVQGSGVKGEAAEEGSEGISDDHVLMIAAEAFGAGVETTSTTLLWILAYLLHHPQVQERVQKELDECVGGGRSVCVSDRPRLPYLDSVINEGLRIRPVSPVLIPHTALRDSRIGSHFIGRGTRVLVNMWAIHHDNQHWEEPDSFRPERFLDDQGQRVVPSCFLPFGAGPRVCVGEALARVELFLFLSSLLQRFSFLPHGASLPDLQGRLGVVLQPLPYRMVAIPRESWEGGR